MNKQEIIDEKIRWDTRYHQEAQEKYNNGYDPVKAVSNEIKNGIEFDGDENTAPDERNTICYNCGEEFASHLATEINGERLCPACVDELYPLSEPYKSNL